MLQSQKTERVLGSFRRAVDVESERDPIELGSPISHARGLGIDVLSLVTLEECIAEVRRLFRGITRNRKDRLPERLITEFALALLRDIDFPVELREERRLRERKRLEEESRYREGRERRERRKIFLAGEIQAG